MYTYPALEPPVAEQLREPGTPYLSPALVGELFGFQVQELAERAHVHRNTLTARIQAPQLQKYLQDMVRVLTVAMEMTGDEKRAAFLLRNEPLRAFNYKTADTLVKEGRTDAVVAYLESLAGGAAG
ncbi:MAG: helix-turn-helix domain-containing protein [Methylobacillus sp.]|nr:helix-turn-helix domain-containing protein [Methylobacillus sp.]